MILYMYWDLKLGLFIIICCCCCCCCCCQRCCQLVVVVVNSADPVLLYQLHRARIYHKKIIYIIAIVVAAKYIDVLRT